MAGHEDEEAHPLMVEFVDRLKAEGLVLTHEDWHGAFMLFKRTGAAWEDMADRHLMFLLEVTDG